MTSTSDQIEIITSVQRRRRWGAAEKVRIVEETHEPGVTVSLVARRHGIAPNQVFTWRRLASQGALVATGAEEAGAEERRHDGRIAVDRSNLRWCSDGFELGCDNGGDCQEFCV